MSNIENPLIIAVDGPSGSGKSTLCREVARRLGLIHMNTGSYYRVIAWRISLVEGFNWEKPLIKEICAEIEERFKWDSNTGNPLWDGQICMKQLNSERMAKLASQAAQNSHVRSLLKDVFRRHGKLDPKGTILEGRDIGTEVFPNAPLKFFIDVSPEVRAIRRFRDEYPSLEGEPKDYPEKFEALLSRMYQRDQRDSQRECAPLVKAEDAEVFLNDRPFRESVAAMLETVREKIGGKLPG